MFILCSILSAIVLIVIIILTINARKPVNYPPGPRWWPVIGCYMEVRKILREVKYYHMVWKYLEEKYGPVIGLKMGTDRIVIVSGYTTIKEVLQSEAFDGRPDGFFYRLRSLGDRLGLVFVDEYFMEEQRRFCSYQLRHLGFKKQSLYQVITKEAVELADLIERKVQLGPVQVHQLFDVSILNTIWTFVAGRRFELEDERLFQLTSLVYAGFHTVDISGGLLNQMPFLRFVAPSLTGYNSLVTIVDEIMNFLKEAVAEHMASDTDDFIGRFIHKMRSQRGRSSFTEKQLLVVLEDMFMAGVETTSSTLSFAILYLVKYHEVQSRIHQEIDDILKTCNLRSAVNQRRLLYLEATIMEIQRHANPVPVTIPHKALRDTKLLNYTIPKGTVILPSLWSIHMDKDYWIDPLNFRPSRFINKNGKIVNHPYFMPFAIGRRKCIGEYLARNSILLFLATLLQKFKIVSVSPVADVDIIDGVTLAPAPFLVNFITRNNTKSTLTTADD